MKKLFSLAAVSVICACGLVIDPDKLVEGNGGDPAAGPDGATDTGSSGGDDAASDVASDVADIVDVPECVPAAPTNAQGGPYAVVSGNVGAPLACPAGYLAKPVAEAKSNLTADAIVCNDPTGCTCGAATGSPSCSLRVRYFFDSACTKEVNDPDTISAVCKDLADENYGKLEINVSGVTCPASGSATPTSKPTPAFRTQYLVCEKDPSVKTAQCKGGLVPLPAAKNASACVVVPTNQPCFGSYSSSRDLSKNGALDDTRACTCSCAASASCIGGSASVHGGSSCSGSGTNVAVGTCESLDGNNVGSMKATSAPTPSTPTCTARATASGNVTPQNDLKLCCLGSSGGGG